MIQLCFYATVVSLVLAIVLAVARDVPLLEAFLPPPGAVGDATAVLIGFPTLACFTLGLWPAAWCLALLYCWSGVSWRLWHGPAW
jgi:hypothetical protein